MIMIKIDGYPYHTYYTLIHSFFTLSKANEPLLGTFSPSIQPRISYAMWTGLAHFVKSLFGIACLFD